MKTVILASGSPRRKKLLEQLHFPFQVQKSSVDEHYDETLPPAEIVQILARRKAMDVARHFADAIIIAADTIVVHQDTILGKPPTREAARNMLLQLSGNTHSVFTGVALYSMGSPGNDRLHTFAEETKVTFGKLNARDINRYVESGSPMDKAGAYGIQDEFGAIFVKRIKGDYNNVVGLPLHSFYQAMQNYAPEYLPVFKNDNHQS